MHSGRIGPGLENVWMKWTIWTTTEPLPPGQATKAQGYSRWGSDLKKKASADSLRVIGRWMECRQKLRGPPLLPDLGLALGQKDHYWQSCLARQKKNNR